jgi:tetratricopeptide (TPR) repeat protein
VIDPDDELPMCLDGPPDYADKKLRRAIADLPWTGAGSEALDLFEQARGSDALGEDEWGKLGLCLYGGKHEDEALTAFRRTAEAAEDRSLWSFTALVWQGMLLDLAGRREDALSAYRAALEHDTGLAMHHSQFDLKIDRAWVEQRLQSPFKRQ